MVEQWQREGGTVDYLMVEQLNNHGGTVEQRWWNTGASDRGKEEHLMVEKWNI